MNVTPQPHTRYKLFLVEEGDDERERVISGLVDMVNIDIVNDEYDVSSYSGVLQRFNYRASATVTLHCVPNENDVLFTIENFNEPVEDNSFENDNWEYEE